MTPRGKGKTEKKIEAEESDAESGAEPEPKPKGQPKAKSKVTKKQKSGEEATDVTEEPKTVEADLAEPSRAEQAKKAAKEQIEEPKEEEKAEEEVEGAKPKEAEEEKAAAEEEEEEEIEIVEEKFYDLNLRRIWATPRGKRTPKAVRFLRQYVARRMKTDDIAISEEANSMLWARGISKPPRKIRVRAVKDKDGHVIVFPGEGK